MNYFTLFPLGGTWGKYLGATIVFSSMVCFCFILLGGDNLLNFAIPDNIQSPTSTLLFALGLFIFSFSKERMDDERVKQIRYTAFRAWLYISFLFTFHFLFITTMAINKGSSDVIDADGVTFLTLYLLVAPLVIYQIVFQIGLWLDPIWMHTDRTTEENLSDSPGLRYFHLGILLAGLIVLILALVLKN